MPNLSQIKRQRMLDFLETLKKEHTDDESIRAFTEIENQLRDKKYGLVWEEHSERVDEMLEENIPIFTEDVDKKITASAEGVYNFILEGDNLQSLYLLEKTHSGCIDIIYIDPPYNTGSKDFKYNDAFVDKADGFRHSKWLSFMYARLKIARDLLSDTGLIFISIDDNEVATLKLLCEEIFGENNFRGQIARSTGTPTGQGNSILVNEIDYILVFSKTDKAVFNGLPFDADDAKIYNCEDEQGKYLVRPLRKTGGEDRREDRPSMYYGVTAPDGTEVFPIAPSGYESRWRCAPSRYEELLSENRIEWKHGKDGWKVYQKFYLEGRTKQPSNLWTKLEGNKKATIVIKKLFGKNVFDFPKPVELIKQIIMISGSKSSVVLDFFAGSGTTGQAVAELNETDGGNRTFILCTNNENNICEGVTYPRIKTVVTGIRIDGTKYSDGIPTNVKYFKCDWTPRKPEDYLLSNALCLHIREMIELQHGIEIDNVRNVLILNKADFRKYVMDDAIYGQIENLWVNQNIIFNSEEMERLNALGFKYIPREFFGQELREAAE